MIPSVWIIVGSIVIVLLLTYLVVPKVMLNFAQNNMIFAPPPRSQNAKQVDYAISNDGSGNGFIPGNEKTTQEYRIPVQVGKNKFRVHVIVVRIPQKQQQQQHQQQRQQQSIRTCTKTVLYCHGNGSDLQRQHHIVDFYTQQRINVILWDYPGYGKSESKPTYRSVEQSVLAVFDWYENEQREQGEIMIAHGFSLGGAAAAYLAARRRAVDGLILESTFLSVGSALTGGVRFTLSDEFCNDRCLKRVPVTTPILILHGQLDDVIACANSQRLFDTVRRKRGKAAENIVLILVRDANHFNARYCDAFWIEFRRLFTCH